MTLDNIKILPIKCERLILILPTIEEAAPLASKCGHTGLPVCVNEKQGVGKGAFVLSEPSLSK